MVAIAQETGIERKRVLRALTYARMAFQKDIPDVFSGTVEVDITCYVHPMSAFLPFLL